MFGISPGPQSVSVKEAYEKMSTEGNCLLDVRTPDEVREVSAPGSVNIPLDQLESQIDSLKKYSSVTVICRSGGRSAVATQLLHDHGLSQAINVTGGMIAWEKAGLPTT